MEEQFGTNEVNWQQVSNMNKIKLKKMNKIKISLRGHLREVKLCRGSCTVK